MSELSWREAVEKADAFKSLGQTRVCLFERSTVDRPWEYVTAIQGGGTHRYDMETTIKFVAEHPSGLSFEWWIELEPREANGKAGFQISQTNIHDAMVHLLPPARKMLARYIQSSAKTVEQHADEARVYVGRQYADAAILRRLAEEVLAVDTGESK